VNDYHEEATEWLKREDGVGREDRTARLQWIASLMPQVEHLTFPGGVLSKYHFEEMRYCFVYGQYLAVVLLGLAYIERTLAASFYGAGRNDLERASISRLLREAVASGMITDDDFERIDRAREIRNAFTHFRRPSHEENIEYRAVTENEVPYEVIERDARHTIETVFNVVERNAV
jgi:uncharacterized membrane protein